MWQSYAQKTLSKADRLALQRHAEQCELCADIKEGIDALAMPETLQQTVTKINNEVDESIKPKRKKLTVLWYSGAAAALVIALGLGWYFIPAAKQDSIVQNTSKQEVTKNTEVAEDTAKPIIVETPVVEEKQSAEKTIEKPPVVSSKRDVKGKEEVIVNADKKEKKSTALQTELTTLDTDVGSDASAQQPTKNNDEESVKDKSIPTVEGSGEVVQVQKTITAKELKRSSSLTDIYPSNMALNNSRYFNNSREEGQSIAPMHDSASYFTALSYYNAKQYDSCLQLLQANSLGIAQEYNELAVLLQAKALIAKRKKRKARSLLNSFIFTSEERRKEAVELLKTIK